MSSFGVTYHITPGKNESLESKIENICIEQSVEIFKNTIMVIFPNVDRSFNA